MHLSTAHTPLPDASAFADVLGPGLTPRSTFSDDDDERLPFRAVALPPLNVPSGRITASDAYILDAEPLTQPVPPGSHPLTLLIAIIHDDERIAFAHVRFAPAPAVRWEMALIPGQTPSELKPGQIFGYGVDSGTGCLADSAAYKLVDAAGQDVANQMMTESRKVYRHTRDWLSVETDAGSFALFSSGCGDGVYPSYFGFSADGRLISLVTDFGLAHWPAHPALPTIPWDGTALHG